VRRGRKKKKTARPVYSMNHKKEREIKFWKRVMAAGKPSRKTCKKKDQASCGGRKEGGGWRAGVKGAEGTRLERKKKKLDKMEKRESEKVKR